MHQIQIGFLKKLLMMNSCVYSVDFDTILCYIISIDISMEPTYTELRCAAKRPHLGFKRCGSLMGGVDTTIPTTMVVRCPNCGSFWSINITSAGNIVMNVLRKGDRIPFKHRWRIVMYGK